MKAIISRETAQGQIAEVGTTNRTVVSHYKTLQGVRKYAKQYAGDRQYRIEFFYDDSFYSAPFRVEWSNTSERA